MKKRFFLILLSLIFVTIIIIVFFIVKYPIRHKDLINKYATEYELPKSMIASVINIESHYDKNSISSAGAVGLMQLLPSTAFDMAERLDIEIVYNDLFDEEININIGCYYLKYLMTMFDDNVINALCAYNWGLSNVKDWILLGNQDKNGTITNIPVEETNNYIKKYKNSKFVYEKIYGFQ